MLAEGSSMAWRLNGTYFENCSCEVACPCTVADFSVPADYDRCQFLMAFHVDSGTVDDVDVSGLTVGIFGDTPAMMVEGNWKVGLFMDANASEQQGAKLAGVFTGQMGGPMAGLAPLITEVLGMESKTIEYRNDGRHHSVRIGDGVAIEVDDIASPLAPDADPPKLTQVHHPASSTLTVARSTASRISAFGYEIAPVGKSGFSAPFSWAG
jgi:hypothetical protein